MQTLHPQIRKRTSFKGFETFLECFCYLCLCLWDDWLSYIHFAWCHLAFFRYCLLNLVTLMNPWSRLNKRFSETCKLCERFCFNISYLLSEILTTSFCWILTSVHNKNIFSFIQCSANSIICKYGSKCYSQKLWTWFFLKFLKINYFSIASSSWFQFCPSGPGVVIQITFTNLMKIWTALNPRNKLNKGFNETCESCECFYFNIMCIIYFIRNLNLFNTYWCPQQKHIFIMVSKLYYPQVWVKTLF